MTPPITYIPSTDEENLFFSANYTYIPSESQLTVISEQQQEVKQDQEVVSTAITHIPLSLCRTELSGVESVCLYLKQKGLRYCDIAKLINRDERSVWDACTRALKKVSRVDPAYTAISIPLTHIQNRAFSFLESVVVYLKDHLRLRNCEIARLIDKNDRTVWTVYNRARKKQHA